MADKITYQDAGVDPEKAAGLIQSFSATLKSTQTNPDILTGIGGFASVFRLGAHIRDFQDPVLVSCCDGVGTKVLLAQKWGDLSGIGIDLVAMNVNDLICAGAKPLVFLDYFGCSKIPETEYLEVLESIRVACAEAQCSLVGGETAEMPGLYQPNDFDLAGFAVGVADGTSLLGPNRVQVGDSVIAIESSGFHSNGYSLVRALVDRENLDPDASPDFSPSTWRELLLAPTRLYVAPLLPLLTDIHALCHVTGGGLFENLPRILPGKMQARIDSKLWKFPPLFQWAQKAAKLTDTEMLSTFNCGVGMLAVVAKDNAQKILSAGSLRSWVVGEIGTRPNGSHPSVLWA